jgi:hypothetical protein
MPDLKPYTTLHGLSRREWLGTVPSVALAGLANTGGASPRALFDWSMADRVRLPYDEATHTFDPADVDPDGWTVTFDARRSRPGSGDSPILWYTWEITGIDHRYSARITTPRFVLVTAGRQPAWDPRGVLTAAAPRLPALGRYSVKLTVTDKAGRGHTTAEQILLCDRLVVSLGDSYASGEGNPDQDGVPSEWLGVSWDDLPEVWVAAMEQNELGPKVKARMKRQPVWLDRAAHRSYRSPHALFAATLARRDSHVSVTYLPFAASGSTIADVHLRDGAYKPRPRIRDHRAGAARGQLGEVVSAVGGRRIDALLLSIGGNDIGFAAGLARVLKDGFLLVKRKGGFTATREWEFTNNALDALPDRFRELRQAVEAALPGRVSKVYLTGYPTCLFPLRKQDRQTHHDVGGLVSLADAAVLRRLGERLNARLAEACRAAAADRKITSRWHFVTGIDELFGTTHGYCSRRSWFLRLDESVRRQGDVNGAFHCNAQGNEAVASRLLEVARASGLS